jgi:hypothetical protein
MSAELWLYFNLRIGTIRIEHFTCLDLYLEAMIKVGKCVFRVFVVFRFCRVDSLNKCG